MADVGDLRQKAEAAKVAYGDLRSLGMHPDRLAIIEEYQAASDPDTFLAALRVIEAAEALTGPGGEADMENQWEALDAAVCDFREAK